MRKIHLDQCPSTQDYLLDSLRNGQSFDLVSAEVQSSGYGRHNNQWQQLKNTLCFSFVCGPNEVLTLTSAEISTLICMFFQDKFKQPLFMKWPNDLLTQEGAKTGGILINNIDKKSVVGVGINLFAEAGETLPSSDYPIGYVFSKPFDYSKKELIQEIYHYILDNRLTSQEVQNSWERLCIHNFKEVMIEDGDYKLRGQFIGIGKNGEALIKKGADILKIYNGSLRIQN